MLQIGTGKFARDVSLHSTKHRFILHTNAMRYDSTTIETVFGNLMPARSESFNAWVIETTEILEAVTLSGEREVLISTGGANLASDLAVVLSFALNLTFTTSEHSLRSLFASQKSHVWGGVSNKFLLRTFDDNVYISDDDIQNITSFTKKLWLLKRTEFKAIMSGIRRYVHATQMLIEEPSLAYALLVMAIEAIEQNTTEYNVDWTDIVEAKRNKIDAALKWADKDISVRVRRAICESDSDKAKAAAKFRNFILSNIELSYYRSEAKSTNQPPSKFDLKQMLQSAYQARSLYVHELKELNNNFLFHNEHAETVWVNGRTHLSFQGLARLVRHVIRQRVLTAEEHPEEQYNYRLDLPNVSILPLASHYWIGRVQGYGTSVSRKYFAACLEQIFQCKIDSSAIMTAQNEVMQEIEKLLPNLCKIEEQSPVVAHYVAYNWTVLEKDRSPKFEDTIELFEDKYGDGYIFSFEFFAVDSIMRLNLDYSFDQAKSYFQKYERQRHHKNGLRLSHRIEATVLLYLAELAHQEGNIGGTAMYVSKAVEALPGQNFLLFLEAEIDRFIKGGANWRDCFIESQRKK